jgi:hypothetical protein
MTALSANRNTKMGYEMLEVELKLAASQTIYQGSLVCRNASGLAVPAADTAGLVLAGVSFGDKRNGTSSVTSTATSTHYVSLRRRGCFLFAAAGLTVADIGKKVYVADDQTVQLAPTNVEAGYLVGIDSATEAWVEINAAQFVSDADAEDKDIEFVGVAANKVITVSAGVCLDADGYLVDMDDATAISFWGYSLEAADNTGGADGAIDCAVQRSGEITFTSSSLVAADLGKEVWQATDHTTVTKTPGTKLVGVISKVISATSCKVTIKPMPIVGQRTDRQFPIDGVMIGACGTGATVFADRQFKRRYICLQGFADALTAPSSTYNCAIALSDGTTTFTIPIATTATHGELLTAQVPTTATMKADFDTDLTCTDDNASATTADINIHIMAEAL